MECFTIAELSGGPPLGVGDNDLDAPGYKYRAQIDQERKRMPVQDDKQTFENGYIDHYSFRSRFLPARESRSLARLHPSVLHAYYTSYQYISTIASCPCPLLFEALHFLWGSHRSLILGLAYLNTSTVDSGISFT
jgi:hypothetical protein